MVSGKPLSNSFASKMAFHSLSIQTKCTAGKTISIIDGMESKQLNFWAPQAKRILSPLHGY
jgi:hypothetical protein